MVIHTFMSYNMFQDSETIVTLGSKFFPAQMERECARDCNVGDEGL
jgi:hypothetical protein